MVVVVVNDLSLRRETGEVCVRENCIFLRALTPYICKSVFKWWEEWEKWEAGSQLVGIIEFSDFDALAHSGKRFPPKWEAGKVQGSRYSKIVRGCSERLLK